MHFMLEAIIVGVVTLCLGYPLSKFLGEKLKSCVTNKNTRHAITLFLVGVIVHTLFELLGFNKVYCEKGYACQRGK